MQRARIIGPKNEKTATGAIFVRMCVKFKEIKEVLKSKFY